MSKKIRNCIPSNLKNDSNFVELASMTAEEIRQLKVDPHTTRSLRALVEQTAHGRVRGGHHLHTHKEVVAGAANGLSKMPPATGRPFPTNQQTAQQRGLFISGSWSDTHDLANALSRLRRADASHAERRECLRWGLDRIASSARAVHADCGVNPDVGWPMIESIEEAAIEVANDPPLWDDFSKGVTRISMASSVALKCALVHGLKEICGRGESGKRLAAKTYNEILRCDTAAEPRLIVRHIANQHEMLRHELAKELDQPIPHDMLDLLIDIDVARREATTLLGRMRIEKNERSYFHLPTVAELFQHQKRGPLSSILSMYALGDVFHCATRFVNQYPEERQYEVRAVFAQHLREQLREDSASHFLTMEMLEPLRDNYSRFTASLMAELIPTLGPRAQQALFVCLVEGYEKKFAGARQAAVPQFVLEEEPRFIGAGHRLDYFGELICQWEGSAELLSPMRWANERLRLWCDDSAPALLDPKLDVAPSTPLRKRAPTDGSEELAGKIDEHLRYGREEHITPDT